MGVRFQSSIRYWINYCNDYDTLVLQLPVEADKIWTIIKTETALIITCNGVEVVNYLFADSSDERCVTRWGGDVVEIQFQGSDSDTASEYYRAGKGIDIIHTSSSNLQHVSLVADPYPSYIPVMLQFHREVNYETAIQ